MTFEHGYFQLENADFNFEKQLEHLEIVSIRMRDFEGDFEYSLKVGITNRYDTPEPEVHWLVLRTANFL